MLKRFMLTTLLASGLLVTCVASSQAGPYFDWFLGRNGVGINGNGWPCCRCCDDYCKKPPPCPPVPCGPWYKCAPAGGVECPACNTK